MNIKIKNKIERMKIKDLPKNSFNLCFDEEHEEYYIIIMPIFTDTPIVIDNSNDKTVCILTLNKCEEVLFVGRIRNFDLTNIELIE